VNDAQRVAEILSDTAPTRPSQVHTRDRPRSREIDADLDNILLMALRKEPQRRYGSVEQFANDLRNYLAGLPVRARGNALRYRMGKFLRRRKVELAAAVVVALSLVGGLWFSIREARIAERERQVAQEHFDSVRKIANTLLFEIHDEMQKVPGSTRTREKLVKTSLDYLDALYHESGTDRVLQEELATAYSKVGDIQGAQMGSNTGDHAGAMQSYVRAIALLEPLVAADPGNHQAGVKLANVYGQQASLLLVANRKEEALASAQKGVDLTELHKDFIADKADRTTKRTQAYWQLVDILAYSGRGAEAMAEMDKMLAVTDEFLSANPGNETALELVSRAYNNASHHADVRLPEPARTERLMAVLKRSLWASEQLVALFPANADYAFGLGITQGNVGRYLAYQGDYAGALKVFQSSSTLLAARARDPNDVRAAYLSALVDSHAGDALFHLGRVDEAMAIYMRCDAVLKEQVARNASLRLEFALGQNAVRIGMLQAQRGKFAEARDWLRKGMPLLNKVNDSVVLESIDRKVIDDAAVALARVEAALEQ
jgi:tetratricopeptide (TPR) repeat protein